MQPIVVWVILDANAAVFLAWQVLGPTPLMTDNFLVSWNALEEGRYWTLLGSEFSHMGFLHFFLNMYVLTTFGLIVEQTIGSRRFLGFYLVAAIVASLGHAGVSAYLLAKPELPALGASGALSGIVLLFALMYPRTQLLLFGIVPLPALLGALLFVGLDVVGLIAQSEGGGLPIGHGAHLGGALTGVLYYFVVIRPLMRAPRREVLDFTNLARWRGWIAVQLTDIDGRKD
ncbi:MAG: rhomboid family intramembrane serine protease [Micropepsaceae bacterium]